MQSSCIHTHTRVHTNVDGRLTEEKKRPNTCVRLRRGTHIHTHSCWVQPYSFPTNTCSYTYVHCGLEKPMPLVLNWLLKRWVLWHRLKWFALISVAPLWISLWVSAHTRSEGNGISSARTQALKWERASAWVQIDWITSSRNVMWHSSINIFSTRGNKRQISVLASAILATRQLIRLTGKYNLAKFQKVRGRNF